MTERGLLLDLGGTAFGSGLERLALLGEREPAAATDAGMIGLLLDLADPAAVFERARKELGL